MSFVVSQVGHVDSGKSTLSGRLLHLLGRISQKQMHKFEKEAKQQVIHCVVQSSLCMLYVVLRLLIL